MTEPRQTHRFGWDGMSFEVPQAWQLSSHRTHPRVSSIEMEDETDVRLQVEWTHPGSALNLEKVQARYVRAAKSLSARAEESKTLGGLPEGWMGFRYVMPGAPLLVVAYYAEREGGLFCMLRLFFPEANKRRAAETLVKLAESFAWTRKGPVLWSFYDARFTLDADFRLTNTSLQAGRKTLVFQWRMRQFVIWHISMADLILRDQTLAQWVADFLSRSKLVRGPIFETDGDHAVRVRRSRWHPLGHMDELGRMCFSYTVGCRHVPARNQIVVWVCQYRWPKDLQKIEKTFWLDGTDAEGAGA